MRGLTYYCGVSLTADKGVVADIGHRWPSGTGVMFSWYSFFVFFAIGDIKSSTVHTRLMYHMSTLRRRGTESPPVCAGFAAVAARK